MSDLSSIEQLSLEKLFEMEGGYVLDFSNTSFKWFVLETIGVDIYADEYKARGTSKANRLRTLWHVQSNQAVAQLTEAMLAYWKTKRLVGSAEIKEFEQAIYDDCVRIVERLRQDSTLDDLDAIQPHIDSHDYSLLEKSIRESIHNHQPEIALDRLHTYLVRYVRQLCDRHGIDYGKNTALHSLFGGYVKHLRSNSLIDSPMTERILRTAIETLEQFNHVRNNQSLAHDNPVLNQRESILIFNNISGLIRFIKSIEGDDVTGASDTKAEEPEISWDDIPF